MEKIKVIQTLDGSHSLINTELNETYHSVHGAIQESRHVFIKNGLAFFGAKTVKTQINVLEIGFGTGLNALLTIESAMQSFRKVHYTSLETYVLPDEIWQSLNYASQPQMKEWFTKIHEADWDRDVVVNENFTLQKCRTSIQDVALPNCYFDVIFFDAFAPNKQPEMWTPEVLQSIYEAMAADAVFVTYCAKGQLKRDLKNLGLMVETLPGPPGKKEMVRALKNRQ